MSRSWQSMNHMTVKMAANCLQMNFLFIGFIFSVVCTHFQLIKAAQSFEIDYNKNTFLKDGKPFRYISGSMHYSRIHPYYWKDALQKMRAAGLNAVQTYVPWNVHELTPGQFYWEGSSDLGRFLTLAQETGLVVLLRLGPYICGEWEFGGFPAWLLTENPDMVFRTSETSYIKWVDKWFTALLNYTKPYLYINGGPVIMVQIENEYGSYFACDKTYTKFLYYKVRVALGDVVIYTTDGCSLTDLNCGKVNGSYATVDFGPDSEYWRTFYLHESVDQYNLINHGHYSNEGNPEACFSAQKFYEPKGPKVNSEFYTGWLDHWGSPHSKGDTTKICKSLDQILALGGNVNMYMFVGGTNFGFMNGANSPPYEPVPTSYDYDAPLTETGDVTLKYYALRDIISKYNSLPQIPVPPNTNKTRYGQIPMDLLSTIQDALPYLTPSGPVKSTYPIPMENINFYEGFILYRFVLTSDYKDPAKLYSDGIRDRAVVMVNSIPFGIMDRNTKSLKITGKQGQLVDILVENQGRIGFSTNMNFNTKGIIGNVTLNGTVISDWFIYPLDLSNINSTWAWNIKSSHKPMYSADGTLMTPSIYVGVVDIPALPGQTTDTFLDPRPWGKGQAIVNHFNLGRYWPSRGPQVTLYIPKPVFNQAPSTNHLFLLELENAPCTETNTCFVTLTDSSYLNGPNGPGSK